MRGTIRRARASLVFLLLGAGLATAASQPDSELMGKVDAFVVAEMRRQAIPGVAIGILSKGQVAVAKGYGEANVEHRVPVSRATVFQSGSVGKQFTAVAVMLQVEDGKLALDDSITKYFADAPRSWRPITVRHLLTHTSGIPDYGPQDLDFRRDHTEAELTKAAYDLPLEFEPGKRWSYSNTGYVLLGILVHRVSGRFYGEVLKERVFVPLGMKTARIISEADIVANRAAGYRLVNGELKNQEWVAPQFNTTADGSLYLALDDYIAWNRGLRAGAILRPQSWLQIYTPATLASGKTYPYGFGWELDESAGKPWYHHGGTWQGFRTYISRYLADDLTIVVLANLVDAKPERFVDGLAAIVDPRLAKLEPTTPMPDSDPAVTGRVRALLENARAGKLSPQDLQHVRRSPDVQRWEALLRPLGPLQRLDLLDRRELGDDRVFTYSAVHREATLIVRLGLAPDDQVCVFDIQAR